MTFDRGDIVNVVDEKLDGTFCYEGRATVLRCVDQHRNIFRVEFSDTRRVNRTLYSGAQKRLLSYIKKMNKSVQDVVDNG